MPPWRSARSSTQRIEASSSTSRTLRFFAVCSMEGQQDREGGQARPALELDEPVVTTDEILRDGESEARAVGSTRHEGIEQRLAQMLRHAGAVVLELHARDET